VRVCAESWLALECVSRLLVAGNRAFRAFVLQAFLVFHWEAWRASFVAAAGGI